MRMESWNKKNYLEIFPIDAMREEHFAAAWLVYNKLLNGSCLGSLS